MALALLSAGFQSLPLLPKAKWALPVLIPMWVGLCNALGPRGSLQWTVGLSCEGGSFSHCCLNPQGVSFSGWRLYFPTLEPWGCPVCFAPPLFLLVYLHMNVGLQGPPATTLPGSCSLNHPAPQSAALLGPPATVLPRVLSTQLRLSAPLTCLDECVIFNSLVVRLPYSSIFCQFWLFFRF